MPKPIVDLLWRDHPDVPKAGRRGPRARHSVSDVVAQAMALADSSGLSSMTVRALADSLGMSTMSIYTYVNSRDDLLVLMVDAAHGAMTLPTLDRTLWRERVRLVAEANLALVAAHPWLLEIPDARTSLGPGTIAKYDHELHAFDGTHLDDIQRDAALTFLLDFVRSSAAARLDAPIDFGPIWSAMSARLGELVGDDYPLARRVGEAAGEQMGAPFSADLAWDFGLERVTAALADLID